MRMSYKIVELGHSTPFRRLRSFAVFPMNNFFVDCWELFLNCELFVEDHKLKSRMRTDNDRFIKFQSAGMDSRLSDGTEMRSPSH